MSPAMPIVIRIELTQPMPSALPAVPGTHLHVTAMLEQIPPGANVVELQSNVLLWSEFRKHPLVKDVTVQKNAPCFPGVRVLS